ncbi:MAG TPA: FAD-binding domain [Gemmatimonadaceae bacterium]|nr:FAD-binding domain [Gemmatimonadaceae bacterium]
MRNRDILISGAGIAGPTLAYWLLRRGFTPTLVERAPALRTGGYMIDFWGVGYDVAERMGLRPTLHEDGYHLEEVRLVDASGTCVVSVDAGVFRTASSGRFLSILRGDLARRLYHCVSGAAETIFADSIAALDEDGTGVTVTFEHAPQRRFDLVIGADGLHSNVRTLAFADSARYEHDLGYTTAAFSAAGYPHRDEGAYVSYAVPGRQVARYALRDGRSAFFFIFANDRQPEAEHHDAAAQKAVLRERFSGAGWECDEILAAMDGARDLYFDTVAQTRMAEWSRGRVALLGDAAYCPSLLAGQGAALAMAGGYVLAHALAQEQGDHIAAFGEYQRRFKPFIDAKQRAAARFGWWFAPRSSLGIRFRNLATNLMRVPYLADRLAARSFGDRFELPSD